MVKILGKTYRLVNKVHKDWKNDENYMTCWGYCDVKNQEIYIRPDLHPEKVEGIIIHEVTHAYHGEYSHYHKFDDVDEFIAEFFQRNGKDILKTSEKLLKEYKNGKTK